jgi:mono/diheme cytochrome c family protein
VNRSTSYFFVLSLPFILVPAARAGGKDSLADRARGVLVQHCHKCHHGEGSEGGEFDVLSVPSMTAAKVLAPGSPGDSLLWQRVGEKKTMPPKAVKERLSDLQLGILREWIQSGAPAAQATAARARSPIPLAGVLAAVRDHLLAADAEDKPYLRYFTLTHLHNNPAVADADLALYRAALSKALNSVSWKSRMVIPEAVDKDQTVFAIDIRDLDWDKDRMWPAVAAAYPYGLRYGGHPDPAVAKLDDDIARLAGGKMPVVRADWFAAVATRPPLYHTLLKLPAHAGELERRLKVDVPDNFRRRRLDRAAFVRSGVSGQNRLIERHDADYGAYWKSYDFKPGGRRDNLAQFPLGPAFAHHPYPDLAFEHDGGEIIFNLPNGLQGYMLVDGKDNRIDDGPIAVVADPLKTSGTNVIVNGLSCMACHKHGMVRPPKDEIRDAAGVFGDARRLVHRLYPEGKRMAALLREDEDRFLRAAEKATGPFLVDRTDKDWDIKAFGEPVSQIAQLYRLQELDLRAVACELGVAKADDLKGLIVGNPRLRQLGLGVLLKDGGGLKRDEWEKGAGFSVMQRAAAELELGHGVRE